MFRSGQSQCVQKLVNTKLDRNCLPENYILEIFWPSNCSTNFRGNGIDVINYVHHIDGNLQAQEKNYQEVLGIYCCDFSGEY